MGILDRIPLWSLFAATILLCLLVSYPGHGWGGDFAGYLGQARALVEGSVEPYILDQLHCAAHSDLPVGPAVYGWGFPMILAPFYALFGLDLAVFKGLMVFFLLGSGLVSWLLFRRSVAPSTARFALALLLFSPALTLFTNEILSDLPFTFFFLTAFVIMDLWRRDDFTAIWGLLLGAWIFWCSWIRPNGVLLLAPVLIWAGFAWSRCRWRKGWRILLPSGGFLLGHAAAHFVLPSYRTDAGIWNAYRADTIWRNLLYYLHEGGEFYSRDVGRYLFWLSLGPLVYAMALDLRRRWPMVLVFLLTVLLYLAWPATQGIRFLYPLFPIYCFYTALGLERIGRDLKPLRWALPGFALVVLLHFTVQYAHLIPRKGFLFHPEVVEGPYTPEAEELWSFVQSTQKEAVFSFFKPRVLYLYGRHRAVYNVSAKNSQAGYFVVAGPTETAPPGQEPVFSNRRFAVYRGSGPPLPPSRPRSPAKTPRTR